MAFEIATPNVGKTLLTTFAALSAENRKAQELELREQKLAQDEFVKSRLQAVREAQLALRGTDIENKATLAEANFGLKKIKSDSDAKEAALDLQTKALAFQQKEADFDAAGEVTGVLSMLEKDGRNLNQMLFSPKDDKEAEEALDIWAKNTARNRGKGPRTDAVINGIESKFNERQRLILARKQAEISARREARMAEDQQGDNERADRAQTERERANKAREGKASGSTSSANKAATVTRKTSSAQAGELITMKGTPEQVASQKRIEDLRKRGDDGTKNALGETHAQEIARLESVLLGAPPTLEGASAGTDDLGLPPLAANPAAAKRPIQGKIYPHKSGKKMRWIGGADGDIDDSANWEVVP